jgi:hypothetical protein
MKNATKPFLFLLMVIDDGSIILTQQVIFVAETVSGIDKKEYWCKFGLNINCFNT